MYLKLLYGNLLNYNPGECVCGPDGFTIENNCSPGYESVCIFIENEVYDQVVFSITGFHAKTIEELSKDEYYEYFIGNYSQLLKRFGRVDGILFHQGESNRWTENEQYYNDFELFYNKLEDDGICSPFYLSLVSYCGDGVDSTLLNIQNNIIIDFENILRGPNTDLLIEPQYRLTDNSHFSLLGYQQFSDMWVNCIINKSEI